jgi:hypothetical protein
LICSRRFTALAQDFIGQLDPLRTKRGLFCSRAGSWQAHSPISNYYVLPIAGLKQASFENNEAQKQLFEIPLPAFWIGRGLRRMCSWADTLKRVETLAPHPSGFERTLSGFARNAAALIALHRDRWPALG